MDMARAPAIHGLRGSPFAWSGRNVVARTLFLSFNLHLGCWQVSDIDGRRVHINAACVSFRPVALSWSHVASATNLHVFPTNEIDTISHLEHSIIPINLDNMAGSSPYGPVVLHQDKASSAGDASSVNSMATRSSTHRSRPLSTASTDSDASSAMSNAWSDKATGEFIMSAAVPR